MLNIEILLFNDNNAIHITSSPNLVQFISLFLAIIIPSKKYLIIFNDYILYTVNHSIH